MKILISGSTGLIGSALIPLLKRQGHTVARLVGRQGAFDEETILWDPATGEISANLLRGIDGVVHLAGESIAAKRWNDQHKRLIRDSRVNGTSLLVSALTRLDPMPKVFASASAPGYYGDRGDELLSEDARPGSDFFASFTREWEEATRPAADAGIRVVNMRFGQVLESVLPRMLMPFKLGVGGRLGSGRQYVSWITREDVTRAISHFLATDSLEGPFNTCSPNPVTNGEFTKALGRALRRPTVTWTPGFALRVLFGEVADGLLASARMNPAKLMASGFEFRHPEIESAIRAALGRP